MPRKHADALSLRALNRATLARQLLVDRSAMPPLAAIESLGGLQSQLARPPFIGLWTRLEDFRREQLLALIDRRQVARGTMLRGTLHLVSADDYLRFRRTLQPMLTAGMQSILRGRTAELDVDALARIARELLDERPRAFDELRVALAGRLQHADERALGYAVRMTLPLVQVPSEGAAWGWDGKAPFAAAESWLGRTLAEEDARPQLVRRYLAAFGPATPGDASAWSGLRVGSLREVFEQLRDALVVLRDERGRELFDLPDAPRPGEDVEPPVRFLPEYDNLMLAHDDRTRVIPLAHRKRVTAVNLQIAPTFLVNGFVAGRWSVVVKRGTATLAMEAWEAVPRQVRSALTTEAERLVRFVEPEAKSYQVKYARG